MCYHKGEKWIGCQSCAPKQTKPGHEHREKMGEKEDQKKLVREDETERSGAHTRCHKDNTIGKKMGSTEARRPKRKRGRDLKKGRKVFGKAFLGFVETKWWGGRKIRRAGNRYWGSRILSLGKKGGERGAEHWEWGTQIVEFGETNHLHWGGGLKNISFLWGGAVGKGGCLFEKLGVS